jgi:hypothetical protein
MASMVGGIGSFVLAAVVAGGCGGSQASPKDATPPAPALSPSASAAPAESAASQAGKQVCCESFGYGAKMVECCTKAVWSSPLDCVVPPGFVGGGKRVVDDTKCPAR